MSVLDEVDAGTRDVLVAYGFDEPLFERLRRSVAAGEISREGNAVRGGVEPIDDAELTQLDAGASALGRAAIERGEVAVAILNGGMATRFGGVVKGTVEAAGGRSFLEWKLRDAAAWGVPSAVMNSFATDEASRAFVGGLDVPEPLFFSQSVSLRLNPDGSLFLDDDGTASPYSPGHGDFLTAIRRSGTLDALRERGVRRLLLSNVDNLGARVDPAVVGTHLRLGRPMTSEVTRKESGDAGGAPVRVAGRTMVVEGFRFPASFDAASIPIFNTNTFVFELDALAEPHELTWLYVEKTVAERKAVQLETLVNELSAFVPTTYLEVPRRGPRGRFFPVKTPADLEAQREELLTMLHASVTA